MRQPEALQRPPESRQQKGQRGGLGISKGQMSHLEAHEGREGSWPQALFQAGDPLLEAALVERQLRETLETREQRPEFRLVKTATLGMYVVKWEVVGRSGDNRKTLWLASTSGSSFLFSHCFLRPLTVPLVTNPHHVSTVFPGMTSPLRIGDSLVCALEVPTLHMHVASPGRPAESHL